jgi:probable DNA metabolism protein
MIVFSNTCDSLIRAFMLSKITQDNILTERNVDSLLFCGLNVVDADSYVLDQLASQFFLFYQRNTAWLHTNKGNELKLIISHALRHAASDKFSIIFKALDDAFFKGINYCLQGTSTSSKKLLSLYHDVNHEVYRMTGFIRFKPFGEKCLVARPLLYHRTIDLLLLAFQDRYPYHKIILITEKESMSIESGKLSIVDNSIYQAALESDDFDTTWVDYYRSQYITSKKNIKLAAKHIPKKYWSWMPEGDILITEENE